MSATLNSRFTLPQNPLEILQMLGGGREATPAGPYPADADVPRPGPSAAHRPAERNGAAPGRDANGQFTQGNRGGPGNPFNREVAALRRRMLAASTPEVFQQMFDALVHLGRSGNVAALKLYFQYTMGKPAEAVDPDRVDIAEVHLLREARETGKKFNEVLGLPYLETMLEIVRCAIQAADTEFRGIMLNKLAQNAPADAEGDRKAEARRAKARQRARLRRAKARQAAQQCAQDSNGATGPKSVPVKVAPTPPTETNVAPAEIAQDKEVDTAVRVRKTNAKPQGADAPASLKKTPNVPARSAIRSHQAGVLQPASQHAKDRAVAHSRRRPFANGGNGRVTAHRPPKANGPDGKRVPGPTTNGPDGSAGAKESL